MLRSFEREKNASERGEKTQEYWRIAREVMINSARADAERKCVLMKAFFYRNTLCISRKNDKIRAHFIRQMPKAN